MKGWMYILLCANGQYYTGSTNDLERRLAQHQMGEGANFTRKHLPVKLVYFEEFQLVSDAFYREKQVPFDYAQGSVTRWLSVVETKFLQ